MTNASHVVGDAATRALARAGAQVLVHDDRSTAKVESVVQQIRSAGGVAKAITADIFTGQGPHQLARQTREIVGERLDILVVNASIPNGAVTAETSVETFDIQHALSTRAPFFLVQQLLPILGYGSSIIFTSPPDTAQVRATQLSIKEAVARLVTHFAPVLEGRAIRVNAITVDALPSSTQAISAAITFLASNESSHITGHTFPARFMKTRELRRRRPAPRRTGVSSHG